LEIADDVAILLHLRCQQVTNAVPGFDEATVTSTPPTTGPARTGKLVHDSVTDDEHAETVNC
jgi:hypothetical protein